MKHPAFGDSVSICRPFSLMLGAALSSRPVTAPHTGQRDQRHLLPRAEARAELRQRNPLADAEEHMPAVGLFVLEYVEEPSGSVITRGLSLAELTVRHELHGKAFRHRGVILIGCLSRLPVQEVPALGWLCVCSPWRTGCNVSLSCWNRTPCVTGASVSWQAVTLTRGRTDDPSRAHSSSPYTGRSMDHRTRWH